MQPKTLLIVLIFGAIAAPLHAQEKTEFGPFISNSFATRWPNFPPIMKGIAVRLDDGHAAMCFDTDNLRCAAGWMGWTRRRFLSPSITKNWPTLLELQGVSFRANLHPGCPIIRGDLRFITWPEPAWKPVDGSPAKGRYRGLYLHNHQVIFSYEIAGRPVLEMYEVIKHEGMTAFIRNIQIAPGPAVTMSVAELPGAHRIPCENGLVILDEELPLMGTFTVGAVIGIAPNWHFSEGKIALALDDKQSNFKLILWNGRQEELPGFTKLLTTISKPTDLEPLCTPGSPLWNTDLTTTGQRSPDDKTYVLDTLNLPTKNPWEASMRLAALDFFPDGRAAISTLGGDVWIVSGIDSSLSKLKWHRFATGLYQAVGLKIIDNKIHILGRDQITRLHDLNNDGEADFYENFNNASIVTERQDECNLGLETDVAGNFYFTKAGAGATPDRLHPHTGTMLKVPANGDGIEVIATGLRSCNGLAIGPNNELLCSDNEGTWSPASRINLIKQGGFYGQIETSHRSPTPKNFDQPIVWLPRAFDTSPSGLLWAPQNWGPLSGHLLAMSYGQSCLYHVMSEEVDGITQGAVFKLPLKFASGCMRGRFNPLDGQLYICGLKGWQTNAASDGSLQRVRFTGKEITMPIDFHAAKNGLFITFTQPLSTTSASDPQNFAIERWNYQWANKYGSPEFYGDIKKPKHGEMNVEGAAISSDGKTIQLKCEDLKPVMQMKITYKLKNSKGEDVRGEIYHTIHKLAPERALP